MTKYNIMPLTDGQRLNHGGSNYNESIVLGENRGNGH